MAYPRTDAFLLVPPGLGSGRVAETIARALQDSGFTTFRPEALQAGDQWSETLRHALEGAALVVIDISKPDPTIWYNLGVLDAFRRPSILIRNRHSDQPLPSDIAGRLFIPYDPNDADTLYRPLRNAVAHLAHRGGL